MQGSAQSDWSRIVNDSTGEQFEMDVLVERTGDVMVATPIAEHLDLSNSESFRHEVISALADCRKLVLDMGDSGWITRGCGAIISCRSTFQPLVVT